MAKKEEMKCRQDPNTKELSCKSFIENKDGTRVDLASLKAKADAQCNPVITEAEEHQPGALDRLEKKVTPRLIGKCKATPSDY